MVYILFTIKKKKKKKKKKSDIFNSFRNFMLIIRWMSGKQCRAWSDAAVCGVRSGSTLFAQAWPSEYLV